MIASALHLDRSDIKALKIRDEYSLHRVVYSLFADIRTTEQKQQGASSGILYADKGGNEKHRTILILTNRNPIVPEFGALNSKKISKVFLSHPDYRFEVIINPAQRNNASRKIVPIKGREAIAAWFIKKAPDSWGFQVNSDNLEISNNHVKRFDKQGHMVTQGYATIKGQLRVTDREQFIKSFQQGIGRGRAFGAGLLQIVPIS
ncbi:type I-E CRISPR-associated protein Cas6/Cse3/CasE [Candidatus Venteria ishoeyi]|uniref:type I-E CRISPR-associated protein Cas6/Cse3/CasE n=1 Tax=Candidatus Venteria ishoeyi TaxID=1899563 RepID=UPI0025A5A612|nr:type I-E CRISPR-associated protein Cas6/Cse3/CasE [Candidatus Venteria ishoeyi]MDM8545408.1 type I-E CRISPR-associated protein Cas6/Cse3/CasE [Candidatus Venteria ishoeyi]